MPLYLVTSIILDRNILPGFPFPLNRKRDVSNIRCQRVEKQRDIGLQLQLKCIKALWIQKIYLSVVLLIYKMQTAFIYFRLMWSTWCFVRVQYGWPALTSPRFPFGSRFFIQHTHIPIPRLSGKLFPAISLPCSVIFSRARFPRLGVAAIDVSTTRAPHY